MEILQKEDEKMMGEAIGDPAEKPSVTCASPKASPEVKTIKGESIKAAGKGWTLSKQGSWARANKDTSRLLLLYDEDPLQERKDLAFAQVYLTRVREALQHIPGKYEDFFRSSMSLTVDLYKSLQILLQDWPQLLKDFAAFLLPEQALACGLVSRERGKDHTLGSLGQSKTRLG
uniref:Uncharacterized protein n=1 Tax=Capra hircus TaxID=9925 RepID=A0A452E700_CAPHI